MLRGSLSARPLALQASGLAFGHPFAALGRCQAIKPEKHKRPWHFGFARADCPAHTGCQYWLTPSFARQRSLPFAAVSV
ncbi:hypothetical protein FRY97_15440 [Phaeodactylibacter luteus]|uniref:Uncharacterized protein n=1 Tax=Phaeodactylibacter luteus TaxID=1564516 RepID=A0A5C6RJQ1_9BACT|nr:hypothetical protein FRY97_15440 [Phaeodactylibacter luteus]